MAKKKSKKKLIITIIIVALAAYAIHYFGLAKYFSRENLDILQNWIRDFGIMAPIIYIGLWIAACVFFLPGLPVAILGGLVFDPLPAVIYASLGSTLGATAAFLIGRYAARGLVEGWKQNNKQVQKIDEGVKKNGWRMLLLTRSVPVFPFNLQNYVYGLTDISLPMYFFVSWVTMIPGTVAYVLMASALASGESPMQILMYIGIAGILIVILSLIPKFIQNSDMVDDVDVETEK